MKRTQLILLVVTLGFIGGTAGLLARVDGGHRLAPPGVVTVPSSDPKRLRVILPEKVLDYRSDELPIEEITINSLPPDTSFGQKRYEAPDGFAIVLNVVLMGQDRTSLHKPQFCLEGQGWHIDPAGTLETHLSLTQPIAYDLPIVRLIADKTLNVDGRPLQARGVYTYWFVASDALSASVSGLDRMWMMGAKLLRTGVLQRWAYVSCFAVCPPGQEEAAFERTQKFIAEAVPQFQLGPAASFMPENQ